jgi:hypothetical protein
MHEDRLVERFLDPEETVRIMFFRGIFTDTGRPVVPDDYVLKIDAKRKELIFDARIFRELLKQAKHTGEDIYLWTISDPSLCP